MITYLGLFLQEKTEPRLGYTDIMKNMICSLICVHDLPMFAGQWSFKISDFLDKSDTWDAVG